MVETLVYLCPAAAHRIVPPRACSNCGADLTDLVKLQAVNVEILELAGLSMFAWPRCYPSMALAIAQSPSWRIII